jgi:exodeoxyribonuclease V alpha subunit
MGLREWIDRQPPKVSQAIMSIPSRRVNLPAFSIWPSPDDIQGVTDHQREKISEALISRIAILAGSPGTGKTYSVAMLIRALLASDRIAPEDIAIGAPTGKAAVRLSEALEAAGVSMKARTWHSLLGVGTDDTKGGWSFQYNEKNPWPFRVIIGDEWSMVDNSLAKSIFAARPRGCHMLLVGDVNQLPPVGAGAPLRDIIASGVCGYGELTEIKRNSGGIVEACAAIRDGKRWEEGDNLTLVDATSETATAKIIDLVEQVHLNGLDPVWDSQVIVAVNDKSELSRKKLNAILQTEFNASPEIKGTPFRLHDKIVCLKNGKYPFADKSNDDKETYVANGELAEVIAVETKRLLAKLRITGDEIVIPRGKSSEGDEAATGCNWDLAYALTCHKLQGSEALMVVVMLDNYPSARRVCDRSWLYAAISRAKQHCFLVGKRHIADSMCRTQNITKRKTLTRERIQLELTKSHLRELF